MSFDFDQESSSSSDDDNIAPRRIVPKPPSSEDEDENHDIDEDLVKSIRNALHLAVGNICREQDSIAANADDNDVGIGMNDSPSFTMSNSAIAALTDLTFHYSTTLLANDLVSFSSHAGRKIIKPEDVLLMSRKDKTGIGTDLKHKMKEIQANNNGASKKTNKKSSSKSPMRKSSDVDRSNSPVRKKKSTKSDDKKSKSKNGKGNNKPKPTVYESSSSSGDESDALALMCQRVSKMEQEKSAQKNRQGSDLDDFIEDDTGYFNKNEESDSEVDFQMTSAKKKSKSQLTSSKKKKAKPKAKPKTNALFNSSASKMGQDMFEGLSDSESSSEVVIGKARFKRIDESLKRGAEGKTEDMAIDLGSD